MHRRILVPLDTSDTAEKILLSLPQVASPQKTELILVTVMDPTSYTYAFSSKETEITEMFVGAISNELKEYLSQVETQLQTQGYRTQSHLMTGDTAQCIVDAATETHADLIAMTTHETL